MMENEELKEEIDLEQIEWEQYRNHPDYNKTRAEYEEEFKQIGGDSFLQFLQKKIEDAMGNQFLILDLKSIYDEVEREEWEHEQWEERVYGPSRNYKASLEGLGIEELNARYKKVLEDIEACKKEIQLIDDKMEYGDLVKSEIHKLEMERVDKADELEKLEEQARILKEKIELEELKSRTTEMTPEEIVEEDLSSLSIEELFEMYNRNNQTITCNEQVIKEALTQKILRQQQQIAEQKAEISRLQGQKEL